MMYLRSNRSSKIPTVLALLLWICVSIVVAGVWFIVAVAAHTVNESLTNNWIAVNAVYPIIGVGIVLVHHRSTQAVRSLANRRVLIPVPELCDK